jgi:hypothetical protein
VAGLLVEALSVLFVAVVKTLGDQEVDGLSRKLLRVVVEQAGGSGIEQDDLAFVICENNTFGGVFKKRVDLVLVGFDGTIEFSDVKN